MVLFSWFKSWDSIVFRVWWNKTQNLCSSFSPMFQVRIKSLFLYFVITPNIKCPVRIMTQFQNCLTVRLRISTQFLFYQLVVYLLTETRSLVHESIHENWKNEIYLIVWWYMHDNDNLIWFDLIWTVVYCPYYVASELNQRAQEAALTFVAA